MKRKGEIQPEKKRNILKNPFGMWSSQDMTTISRHGRRRKDLIGERFPGKGRYHKRKSKKCSRVPNIVSLVSNGWDRKDSPRCSEFGRTYVVYLS